MGRLGVEVVFESSPDRTTESEAVSGLLRCVGTGQGRSAGYAAIGYAQVTGKTGVCIVRSGPDATDLATPLVDAQRDSVPIVALTIQPECGDGSHNRILDICGMAIPIAKHSVLLTVADELPRVLAESFHIASTGRPGVVVIDLSESLLHQMVSFSWPPTKHLPGYRPRHAPHHRQIRAAVASVLSARAPVLFVGGGVVSSGAASNLYQWVELTGIPVVTTTMARGAFPDSHRLHYGMPGVEGARAANQALHHSDLIIALGTRFDSHVTGSYELFSPGARIVHADIDPSEISRRRSTDISIVGDCAHTITALTELFRALRSEKPVADLSPWINYLDQVQASSSPRSDGRPDGQLSARFVVEALGRLTRPNDVYVSSAGPHRMLAANRAIYERPRLWLNSGSPGSHGYALSAAVGAKIGVSNCDVWALEGDQSFLVSNHGLAAAVAESSPIKVALLNSGTGKGGARISPTSHLSPDFVKIAEGWGCCAFRCESQADVESVVLAAQAVDDRPAVIDFTLVRDSG